MEIIPAILTKDIEELGELVRQVAESGRFERMQVDFVDEEFSNATVPVALADVKKYRGLKFDAHLMISPGEIYDEIDQAKINGYERIIAQVESLEDQGEYLAAVEGFGRGLAVDLETSVEELDEIVLPQLDVVLLLAVEAGFGGQMFDNRVIEKVKEMAALRKNLRCKFKICVDGGVEKLEMGYLEELGADEVAVGARRVLSWQYGGE